MDGSDDILRHHLLHLDLVGDFRLDGSDLEQTVDGFFDVLVGELLRWAHPHEGTHLVDARDQLVPSLLKVPLVAGDALLEFELLPVRQLAHRSDHRFS